MNSYVQHRDALHISDHVIDIDTPVKSGDGLGEYSVVEWDIKNYLFAASESNNRDFVLGDNEFGDPKNDAIG